MAAPSSWRIKKTALGKRTEDSEGRIKAKLTKKCSKDLEKISCMQSRGMGNFNICSAGECCGVQAGAA